MTEIITDLEVLATPAEPLKFIAEDGLDRTEGDEIVNKLLEVMNKYPEILALNAPQLGINKRIFGIRFNDEIKVFIDPIILKKSNYVIAPETFVSMPGKEILISRPEELTVVYNTAEYKYEENKLLGPAARLFDQQCQALDGVLPDALGLVSDVETDGSLADLSDDEIKELIEFYKQFVQVKTDAIKAKIAEEPELDADYRKLAFSEKVVNGKAAFVTEDKKPTSAAAKKAVMFSGKAAATQEKIARKANLKQFLGRKGK